MKLWCVACFTVMACGGAVAPSGAPDAERETDSPIDATSGVDAVAQDAGARQVAPEVLGALPRCLHSPDADAGLCQQMRFGERLGTSAEGWCAFWVTCP